MYAYAHNVKLVHAASIRSGRVPVTRLQAHGGCTTTSAYVRTRRARLYTTPVVSNKRYPRSLLIYVHNNGAVYATAGPRTNDGVQRAVYTRGEQTGANRSVVWNYTRDPAGYAVIVYSRPTPFRYFFFLFRFFFFARHPPRTGAGRVTGRRAERIPRPWRGAAQ